MPSAAIIGLWWAMYLLHGFVSWIVPGSPLVGAGVQAFFSAIAAVLCAMIVRSIDRGQDRRVRA
jgi:hypothetical protein